MILFIMDLLLLITQFRSFADFCIGIIPDDILLSQFNIRGKENDILSRAFDQKFWLGVLRYAVAVEIIISIGELDRCHFVLNICTAYRVLKILDAGNKNIDS